MATMDDIIRRGEIYYVFRDSLSPAVGSEQDAGRPAIIVSNDMNNKHSKIVDVVFLTTRDKKPLPVHVYISTAKKASIALCEQIHSVDKYRIGQKCGEVTPEDMHRVDEALCISLGINVNVNGSKCLKIWSEAYDAKGNGIIVPKKAPEQPEPKPAQETRPAPKPAPVPVIMDIERAPEYVRVAAERDVYRQLYQELLEKR